MELTCVAITKNTTKTETNRTPIDILTANRENNCFSEFIVGALYVMAPKIKPKIAKNGKPVDNKLKINAAFAILS